MAESNHFNQMEKHHGKIFACCKERKNHNKQVLGCESGDIKNIWTTKFFLACELSDELDNQQMFLYNLR